MSLSSMRPELLSCDAKNIVALCPQDAGLTTEDCFGTNDDSRYQVTDLGQDWRLWVFQYCTQWGYLTVRPSHHRIITPGDMHCRPRHRMVPLP